MEVTASGIIVRVDAGLGRTTRRTGYRTGTGKPSEIVFDEFEDALVFAAENSHTHLYTKRGRHGRRIVGSAELKNIRPEVYLNILRGHRDVWKYIEGTSLLTQVVVLSEFPEAIVYMADPCERAQYAAVRADGRAAAHIKNPSQEICVAAVMRTPRMLLWFAEMAFPSVYINY